MRQWLFLLPVVCTLSCSAQQTEFKADNLGVMFYNLENLFDTIDDPATDDKIFLPNADRQWNSEKYHKKLTQMARVMSEGPGVLPMVVGLCEVENESVVKDLVAEKALTNAHYKYVHYDSPDERGIDVALLYNPDYFTVVAQKAIPVHLMQNDTVDNTRDILAVTGKIRGAEQLMTIFVNHWPSRAEGEEQSAWKRGVAAETLRNAVDSVRNKYPDGGILIMGDFNDTPFDASIQKILGAEPEAGEYSNRALVDLSANDQQSGSGSYNYKGNWQALDQIIVSSNLLDGKGLEVLPDQTTWIRKDWMLFHHNTYGDSPNRTYSGTKWYGGFSDHLPAYTMISVQD